eukprot:1189044-Prorocentrum_minimum.AAC.1
MPRLHTPPHVSSTSNMRESCSQTDSSHTVTTRSGAGSCEQPVGTSAWTKRLFARHNSGRPNL